MTTVLRLTGILLVVGACVADDPNLGVEEAGLYGRPGGCEDLYCGNAGQIAGRTFYELDTQGTRFSPVGGLKITGFSKAGVKLTIGFAGVDLLGIPAVGAPYARAGLVGAKFDLISDTGQKFEMTIDASSTTDYYEDGADDPNEHIPTFRFKWNRVYPNGERGPLQPVCPTGTVSMIDRHALVYWGDRYNSVTGDITAPTYRWANFACNDTAMWKAFLGRFAEVTQDATHQTELVDRIAMVRSVIADYCGDGTAHTILGTSVDWLNKYGWFTMVGGLETESVWTDTGAICLTKGRYEDADSIVCPTKVLAPCTEDQEDEDNFALYGTLLTKVPP